MIVGEQHNDVNEFKENEFLFLCIESSIRVLLKDFQAQIQ